MRAIAAVSFAVVGLVAYLVMRPRGTLAPGVSVLPAVNAALNGTAAVLLTAGWVNIRRRNVARQRIDMIGDEVGQREIARRHHRHRHGRRLIELDLGAHRAA